MSKRQSPKKGKASSNLQTKQQQSLTTKELSRIHMIESEFAITMITQFNEAQQGVEKLPYLEISVAIYSIYTSKKNVGWTQLFIDPIKLPGFSDVAKSHHTQLQPIFKSMNISAMPGFIAYGKDAEGKQVLGASSSATFMALSGVGAYPSGTDERGSAGLFQPQRHLFTPSPNQNWRQVAHINYIKLQQHQQALIQTKLKDGGEGVCLCSIACTNPMTGNEIVTDEEFTVNFKLDLTYYLPIYVQGLLDMTWNPSPEPANEPGTLTSDVITKPIFPTVNRLVHMD